jgi:hypothetical protein
LQDFDPFLATIEEGRAASKSPHYKFGYFLSISQQGVSADIIQNSAVRKFMSLFSDVFSFPMDFEFFNLLLLRQYDMNGRSQMQEGNNWILP